MYFHLFVVDGGVGFVNIVRIMLKPSQKTNKKNANQELLEGPLALFLSLSLPPSFSLFRPPLGSHSFPALPSHSFPSLPLLSLLLVFV